MGSMCRMRAPTTRSGKGSRITAAGVTLYTRA
jgi:hypothetical protein